MRCGKPGGHDYTRSSGTVLEIAAKVRPGLLHHLFLMRSNRTYPAINHRPEIEGNKRTRWRYDGSGQKKRSPQPVQKMPSWFYGGSSPIPKWPSCILKRSFCVPKRSFNML